MFKLTMYIFIYLLLSGCQPEQYNGPVAEKISHRGYDENKINGFIEAINDGYSILEADVRLRNNTPTLLHDDKACSDCSTLSELLELAQNKGIILFLEFKEFKAIAPSLELISRYTVDVVLTSFNIEHLIYLNANTNYSLGFITNEHYNLEELPAIDYLIINYQHINKCAEKITCVAWGVKSKKQFNKVKYKVPYVITERF